MDTTINVKNCSLIRECQQTQMIKKLKNLY